MTLALFANAGQTITLAVQVLDGYGERTDGYAAPSVDYVRFPDGSFASGYAVSMTKVSTGVFIHSLTLPTGSDGLGTFLASVSWTDPDDSSKVKYELFLIQSARPFGNSSVSPA